MSNPNGPLDHDPFLLCARDTVKLLRNHPSLAVWVEGNEQVPPDDINKALKNDLRLHPYFENSNLVSKSSEYLSWWYMCLHPGILVGWVCKWNGGLH